jgi:hypothetical protein
MMRWPLNRQPRAFSKVRHAIARMVAEWAAPLTAIERAPEIEFGFNILFLHRQVALESSCMLAN